MSRDAIRISSLILSADSARDGHETLTALAKKMLSQVEPGCRTYRIEFEPQNAFAVGHEGQYLAHMENL